MSIKRLLTEELTDELNELNKMDLGKDEYVKTVGGVSQLTDRLIKLEELELKETEMAIEEKKIAIEEAKMLDDREDKKARNRTAMLGVWVPAVITGAGAIAMFILEGKGVIFPTQGERNIISRIFRSK